MDWLKLLARTVAVTAKRLYDILATYLLFWTLYFAAVSVVLRVFLPVLWRTATSWTRWATTPSCFRM